MSLVTEDKSTSASENLVEKPATRRVQITRIKPYDRNPRHSVNQEYDRIKVSIRTQGMDQPLVITQRPGKSDYMVQAGGNTRLRILQDLYAETQDERFLWVDCVYKPWVCESEVMLAHLRENDLRSDLTFIDRARAVLEAKALIEAETGQGELSQRQLEKILKARGYSIAHGLISKMVYAVGTLLPLIPLALEAGLGRLPVERIRRLERAARVIWQRRGLEKETGFDEVFATLCRRHDSIDWDLEPLREAIEMEIAEQSEVSLQTIRVELEAQMAGRELVKPPVSEEIENQPVVQAPSPTATQGESPADSNGAMSPEPTPNFSAGEPLEEDSESTESHEIDEAFYTETEDHPIIEHAGPSDLKSLRARSWTLAARLAQRNGIGDLIVPLPSLGLGYLLRDVPDPALTDQLDDDTLGQIAILWWHLAACAELTVGPLEVILRRLSEHSVLHRALADPDSGLLFQSVWTLDPGQQGQRLWRRLGDRDWQDLLQLMDTYRRIHRLAEESQTRLWGTA
ncbi:MAG: ParB N-terminal domain-containing protein [Candidatus Thiodiazotropha endolucinida]|nr:ParB N-terminal domain-containing protein [Candidatus Thiodiazotropha endolucinida]